MKENKSPPQCIVFMDANFKNHLSAINMKRTFHFKYILLVYVVAALSCKKKHDNHPCEGLEKPNGAFVIKEMIGDTAFVTDTIFRDNYAQFQAGTLYENVNWKLGSDPRTFTQQEFTLSFFNTIGTLPVVFTGRKTPNTICFPGDNGSYSTTQNLTIVEQLDKPNVTISPLVGRYKGYFTDNPSDTFTTRIEYFDSTKYDIALTGSKNFYWLSNIPKGFQGTTSAAFVYPELKQGLSVEMGYKCLVFGTGSSNVQGKGWLSHDTLFINYGNAINSRKKFIGKKN
jgi:hypothetical protein